MGTPNMQSLDEQQRNLDQEYQTLADRLKSLKELRGEYGRKMVLIQSRPKTQRTQQEEDLLFDCIANRRLIDQQVARLRERYQVVMIERSAISAQRKAKRQRAATEQNEAIDMSSLSTRGDVANALLSHLSSCGRGTDTLDRFVLGELLNRLETIVSDRVRTECEKTHNSVIADLRSDLSRVTRLLDETRHELNVFRDACDRLRTFIRGVWKQRVPAADHERVRGYVSRIMIDGPLARDWEDQ